MSNPTVSNNLLMMQQQATNRSYLAAYIMTLSNQEGWWYRILPRTKELKNVTDPHPADVLPHLAVLLGLPKRAIVKVLKEMGLVTVNKRGVQNEPGEWEKFISTHMLKEFVEVAPTSINRNGKEWYIRIGTTKLYPTKIYNLYKSGKTTLPSSWIGLTSSNTSFFSKIVNQKSLVDSLLADGLPQYEKKSKAS